MPTEIQHCFVLAFIRFLFFTISYREESMGQCPNESCGFVFCIYCKATYHGREPCRVKSLEHQALIREYLGANPTSKERLERRYGKRQLGKLADEFLSESFKEENAQRCPRCKAPIEKSDGCNKMTCNKCVPIQLAASLV